MQNLSCKFIISTDFYHCISFQFNNSIKEHIIEDLRKFEYFCTYLFGLPDSKLFAWSFTKNLFERISKCLYISLWYRFALRKVKLWYNLFRNLNLFCQILSLCSLSTRCLRRSCRSFFLFLSLFDLFFISSQTRWLGRLLL